VAHALERIWRSRSRLGSDRQFNHVRQSMHYFVSNLLYYLQVDVVDSEFCQLMDGIRSAQEFQLVYKLHKRFLATVCRLSFVDNAIIKESIDKILATCVRFIALCRLKFRQETDMLSFQQQNNRYVASFSKLSRGGNDRVNSIIPNNSATSLQPPLIIPPQELTSIKSDFMGQIGYLFKAVSSLDDQKFLYRLDFNGYFSKQFI